MAAKLILLVLTVVLLAGSARIARGQGPVGQPAGKPPVVQQPVPSAQPNPGHTTGKTEERRAPAAEYTLALMATLGLLVIVCMPSRKR
jgi:hypothetical protein